MRISQGYRNDFCNRLAVGEMMVTSSAGDTPPAPFYEYTILLAPLKRLSRQVIAAPAD